MRDTRQRICIIGGGPAGISAAMYLEKFGYRNYEIYEKLGRVGGKSYSPVIHVRNNEARTFEVGAIMGNKTYYAVHELEQFAGVTHTDGPNLRRMYRDSFGQEVFPFDSKKDPSFDKTISLLKLKKQTKRFVELMNTKYRGYDCYGHVGVAQGRYSGLSRAEDKALRRIHGVNPNLKDLAMPFDKFCRINEVEEVMKTWIGPFTALGCGYFDEIPSAYVLKHLNTTAMTEFTGMRQWTWKEGTQSIYEAANRKLANPAHLHTEVVKVERPENEPIRVTIEDAGGVHTEAFDRLIVTTPLNWFMEYADANEEERDLFSRILHEKLVDFIATFEPGDGPSMSGYILDNLTPQTRGHAMVYYHRWEELGDDCPCTVYALRGHLGDKDVDYDYTIQMMEEDMKRCGFQIKERLHEQETYSCPHISTEDYAAGWYDRLEALQGNRNTFYAGEILSFGDMEDTCASSRDIVGRFFK